MYVYLGERRNCGRYVPLDERTLVAVGTGGGDGVRRHRTDRTAGTGVEVDVEDAQRERWFIYNVPKGNQSARYERVRSMGKQYAELIELFCPESPERDLAITNLRQAIMWANAAIACNE